LKVENKHGRPAPIVRENDDGLRIVLPAPCIWIPACAGMTIYFSARETRANFFLRVLRASSASSALSFFS
jgi:hypothetical protein